MDDMVLTKIRALFHLNIRVYDELNKMVEAGEKDEDMGYIRVLGNTIDDIGKQITDHFEPTQQEFGLALQMDSDSVALDEQLLQLNLKFYDVLEKIKESDDGAREFQASTNIIYKIGKQISDIGKTITEISTDEQAVDLNVQSNLPVDEMNETHCKQEGSFECYWCKCACETFEQLATHLSKHIPPTKPLANKIRDKYWKKDSYSNRNRSAQDNERPFGCVECGKHFKQGTTLNQHMRIHTNEKPYECRICHKCFRQQAGLDQHMRRHTNERPYGCKLCKKRFRQKAILDQHFRIHTNEKPFECKICGNHFRQKVILDQHMRTHTNERPYGCDFCGKYYKSKSALDQHVLTHTNKRPYGCDLCGKHFKSKMCLGRHLLTHSNERPYECNFCGKHFKSKICLGQHMRTHTKARAYLCDVCKKRFKFKLILRNHMRSHIQ